jgi:hypothetical protein
VKKLKRKPGDKVILNEKWGKDSGKEAIISHITKDEFGREWYRLRCNGVLDPYNWIDKDFKDE